MYILEKLHKFVSDHYFQVIHVICFILFFMAGYLAYIHFTTYQVTVDTQKNAETPQGVINAAEKARVTIDNTQAKEVAKEIHYITEHEVQPVYITQTTGDKVEKISKEESKKNKADFSILTDPKNPDKKYDLSTLTKNDIVNLNQYNIKAYKKVIRTIEYAPTEKIVGGSVQWKVNKSGLYVGIGIDHDIDDHKTYGKVMISW